MWDGGGEWARLCDSMFFVFELWGGWALVEEACSKACSTMRFASVSEMKESEKITSY